MPIFFANVWQILNISTMCGMSNSSVVTKIKYDKDIDPGVVVTNSSMDTRAPAINAPWIINMCDSNRW